MKPLITEYLSYKNNDYKDELFISENYKNISPIKQVHAVCFLDKDTVVFSQKANGELGNLGGGFEKNETIEDVLKRELIEEGQLKLLSWNPFGYEKVTWLNPEEKINYFLRTVAKVELIDKPIVDPCKKSVARRIVPYDMASKSLNWGKRGELLLFYAREAYVKYLK